MPNKPCAIPSVSSLKRLASNQVEVLRSAKRSKTEERSNEGIYTGFLIPFQRKVTFFFLKIFSSDRVKTRTFRNRIFHFPIALFTANGACFVGFLGICRGDFCRFQKHFQCCFWEGRFFDD